MRQLLDKKNFVFLFHLNEFPRTLARITGVYESFY